MSVPLGPEDAAAVGPEPAVAAAAAAAVRATGDAAPCPAGPRAPGEVAAGAGVQCPEAEGRGGRTAAAAWCVLSREDSAARVPPPHGPRGWCCGGAGGPATADGFLPAPGLAGPFLMALRACMGRAGRESGIPA